MSAQSGKFVDKEVMPVASAMEHRNEYPHALVEQMQRAGPVRFECSGRVRRRRRRLHHLRDDLRGAGARLAGALRNHRQPLGAVRRAGALRNRRAEAPVLARAGDGRTARRHLSIGAQRGHGSAEHHAPRRRAQGDTYRINGSKMWVTNGRYGNTFLLLAKTDPARQARAPRHERVRDREGRAGPDRQPRHRQAGLQERRNLRAALRRISRCRPKI